MPKISVIVPIYKVEPYLRECIDSILKQNFSDFELILVDDGSPDNCPKICDEYAKKDSRIRVLHKKNGGLSSARNAGLKVAKGDFLSFVDSDDLVSSDFLLTLFNAIIDFNSDIAVCQYTSSKEYLSLKEKQSVKILKPCEYWTYNFSKANSTVVWNKLYRKEIFDDILFPEGKTHEDEFVIDSLIYSANTIVVLENKLYFYRIRTDSIMAKGFNVDYVYALIHRIEFYNINISNKKRLKDTIYLLISIFCNRRYKNNFKTKKEYNSALKSAKKTLLRIRKENLDQKNILHIRIFGFSKTLYVLLKKLKHAE